MELVSQENMLIGEPEPCQFQSTQIFTPELPSNASQNMVISSASQEPVSEREHMHKFQESIPRSNRIRIIELTAALAKQ